jgi:ankyrin repeat protein
MSKQCKDNQVLNPKSNRCVSRTGKIGKKFLKDLGECPPEKVFNPLSKRCVSRTGKVGKKLLSGKMSPKKMSPKKMSPKKMSPKKMSPKKMSPKKMSPKKMSPVKFNNAINKIKNLESVDEIIDELQDIDIFSVNSEGDTIGHLLLKNKELDDEDIRDVLKELINEYNYNINALNSNNESILQIAVYNHDEDLVEFLLEENARFDHMTRNPKSRFRNLNLYEIARLKSDSEDTIEVLEKYDLYKGEEAYFKHLEE